MFFFFLICPHFCPRKTDCPLPPTPFFLFLPQVALGSSHFPFSLFIVFHLMGVFEAWKEGFSKSKLPLELHFEHIESKLKGFDFKFLFLFLFFFHPFLWVMWNLSRHDGMEINSWKIHKILAWNKVHSRNMIYIIFHPSNIDFTCEFKLPHLFNICKTSRAQSLFFLFHGVCKETLDSLLKAMAMDTPTNVSQGPIEQKS